jgi:hypothetical protein
MASCVAEGVKAGLGHLRPRSRRPRIKTAVNQSGIDEEPSAGSDQRGAGWRLLRPCRPTNAVGRSVAAQGLMLWELPARIAAMTAERRCRSCGSFRPRARRSHYRKCYGHPSAQYRYEHYGCHPRADAAGPRCDMVAAPGSRTRTRRSACAPRCCTSLPQLPGAGPRPSRRSRPPRAGLRRAHRVTRPTGPGPSGRRPGYAGCAWWAATRRPGHSRRLGRGWRGRLLCAEATPYLPICSSRQADRGSSPGRESGKMLTARTTLVPPWPG